jgi:hypothetical protein
VQFGDLACFLPGQHLGDHRAYAQLADDPPTVA